MGASANLSLLTQCQPGTGNEEWEINDLAQQIYGPLIAGLKAWDFQILEMPYDWRKSITDNAPKVASIISANIPTQSIENVHILGHSMGGLIGSAHVKQAQADARVDRMLSVASPFAGSPQAYLLWAGGELPQWAEQSLLLRFAFTLMMHTCGIKHHTSAMQAVHDYVPSVQSLLPTYDYLRDQQTNALLPLNGYVYKNDWLPQGLMTAPYPVTRMGTFTGTGRQTLSELVVKPPNPADIKKGIWLGGKPLEKLWSTEGDGTVLASSGRLSGTTFNLTEPLGHIGLIASQLGINTILNFYGIDTPIVPVTDTLMSEPDSALIMISDTTGYVVTTPHGNQRHDRHGMAAVLNPSAGTYGIWAKSHQAEKKITVMYLMKNGKNIIREIPVHSVPGRQQYITIDENQPDILLTSP